MARVITGHFFVFILYDKLSLFPKKERSISATDANITSFRKLRCPEINPGRMLSVRSATPQTKRVSKIITSRSL